ncbi:D-alanyl-D-alanine carboxypeptidase [Streptomyces sp. NPDC001046]|uniref:D-alanyl-D-alanine carboxypeptidase n=1 Tax=Streptomyces sp. NPDC001046 TaxID=3364543 RepID=UPI003689029E
MAGESPDRSKQRESSAEPTSGSAGPVPGARSESADPRLAVARDTKSARTSSAARGGGVDTATRVLSVRADADAAPDADADAHTDADADTDAKPAPAGAERAERAEADSGGSDATAATDTSAATDVTDPADGAEASDAAGDAERAEGDSGARDPEPDSGTRTEAASDGEAADAEGSGEPDDYARSRGRGAAASTGEGRLRDAVAAWVATADQDKKPADGEATEGGAAATRSAASRGDGDADESTKAGSDAAAARDEDGAPEADRSGAPGPAVAAGPSEGPAAETDEAPGTDATDATDAEEDTADGPSGPAAETDATPGTDAADARDTAPGDAGKPAARYTDQPTAVFRTDAKRSAEGPGKAAREDTGEDAGGPGKSGGDGKSAAPYVDQPTAVFKAVRPPVDQATTMLKLGDAAKDAPRSDRKAGPGDARKDTADATPEDNRKDAPEDAPEGAAGTAPEKDAERTSTFVALKPLDDPATRKPPSAPKAGAAAAAGATTAPGQKAPATPEGKAPATPEGKAPATPERKAPAGPAKDAAGRKASPAEATAAVPVVGPERTTQQPLPPKPPLDLLAELTNTPPPPETPLRTAVRRVKIWTPIALLLLIVFAVAQSLRPLPAPTLDLTAKDSYTFEGGKADIPWPADGQAALDVQGIGTFGSSGEQRPVPIASVAKVMTAYVILRDHPLKSGEDGPKIGIDQAAEDQSDAGQESTVDVTKGDKISQREALEGILIASANNVARLLARWDAGSEKAFVQKMNDAAEDLGMKNSTYTDPSGLNNTTVSTAVDQVKLAKAAMQQPAFREVAAMMSYVDYKGVKHDNWNRLVGYNDVTGIKTGTTTSALGNLVFSAKKDVNGETRRIIGAVVRQPAGGPDNTILGAALHEGDKLIRAAQGALESATILKKGAVVGYADDGLGGRTPVVVTKDVTAVGWAGLSVELTFAADELPHQAKAGTKVGTLTVGDGSSGAVKVPVALKEDLVEPGFADKLTRIG